MNNLPARGTATSHAALSLIVARLLRALETADGLELTIPQYRVLGLLSVGDERAGRLAKKLAVTKPAVTSVIGSLVERGYVTRETMLDDRRAVTVSITPAGRKAVDATASALDATLAQVLSRCADPAAVAAAISQLGRALDEWWDAQAQAQSEQAAR